MTSPTAKQPPGAQLEKIALLEQVAATLHYKNQQLERTLWLAAMRNGGLMLLDEQDIDILWRLSFERMPDKMLKVTALKIEEATEADIDRTAKDLIGTNALLSEYAAAHERLKEYPLPYLEFMLSKHIRHDGTQWISVADFEAKLKTAPPPPS